MRGRPSRRTRSGFTLVEVLVALFVVALGIVGAAGLQAVALRAAGEAGRLADGMRLATSLAERMRANPRAMAQPDAANPYLQFDTDDGVPAAPSSCYAAPGCTPAALAAFDLAETAAQLASRFPGARMRVCRDAGHADASGLLAWECSGGAEAPLAIKLGWRTRPSRPGVAPAPVAPVVYLGLGAGAP